MSEHLPECGYSPGQPGFGGINSGIPSTQPYLAPSPCICDRLRACEQRVLDAAREAVATITFDSLQRDQGPVATQRQVLTAIDALREKP